MVHIEEVTHEEYKAAKVNSIAKRYKELRQESKAPTFLL